jgi:GTP:adenosylcobinamide-phosphate guanylyltransferase
MGNSKSKSVSEPSLEIYYDIFMDDVRIIESVSAELVTETLSACIDDITISQSKYNCFVENYELEIHIVGIPKNNPVIYPTLLHVVRVEDSW